MLVEFEFANVSLLLKNHRIFAKIAKNTKNVQTSSFWDFSKKSKYMPRVVWAGDSKTGLSFEIGQSQQKFQRKSTLQSLANPAVSVEESDVPYGT